MSIDRKILLNIAMLKGISVMKLANENDISQANLSRWFKEQKGGYVKEEKIEKMAKYLGVDFKTGKLLPGVYHWRIQTPQGAISFVTTLNSVCPSGGELTFVRIMTEFPNVLAAAEDETLFEETNDFGPQGPSQEYIGAVPYDRSFRIVVDIDAPSMTYLFIGEELEKTNSSWKFRKNKKGDFFRLTFSYYEKGVIDRLKNESLSMAELDSIMGVEDPFWTWEHLVSVLKEQGRTPGEVARSLYYNGVLNSLN